MSACTCSCARSFSTGKFRDTATYCLELIRRNDYEGFLCSLLLSQSARSAAMAIRAFNVEIAKVQDSVSDQKIGEMKMQFWKDAMQNIYKGNPPDHPVAIEVAKAVKQHDLSRHWFSRIIDAREKNLTGRPPASLQDCENYGENTVSSVIYLTLECHGVQDVHADHAASHIGKATGLVTLLRAVAYHSSKSRVLFPQDLMLKHRVSEEQVLRGAIDNSFLDLCFEIASQSRQHLSKAKSLRKDVPKPALPVMLPAVPGELYLAALQKAGFNVFDGKLQTRSARLPLVLWWNKFRLQY